ncbi:serine/threonine protein kinase [Deinococcus roseus]|uniref:Serine/threonine protein kinase n=1 Tax=Deinococcus roseus TaxID=392414 RepID=A0ABQ2DFV1_9DEIO|nr:serine/threonine-protein kinase [Deinococcus roseus]GGJ56232.1 serine/threonine protein kinase [Deinococcus roseus]
MRDYTVTRILAKTGMALVRVAEDPNGEEVALKTPLQSTLDDPDQLKRFANEIGTHLQLNHNNIVRVVEGSAHINNPYIVMHYYPDGSLDRYLQEKGKPELIKGLKFMRDVGTALHYLHEQGFVHQDIKSSNIFLQGDKAVLGDFGVTVSIQNPKYAAGSPFYMAPEIYRGEPGSIESDVYSLGILTYETLTGNRPYHGKTYDELLMAHLTQYPKSLLQNNPDLTRKAALAIEKALAKSPRDRIDLNHFIAALDENIKRLENPSAVPKETAPVQKERYSGNLRNTPAQHSEPEEDKKGFFQRLFGKKRS